MWKIEKASFFFFCKIDRFFASTGADALRSHIELAFIKRYLLKLYVWMIKFMIF